MGLERNLALAAAILLGALSAGCTSETAAVQENDVAASLAAPVEVLPSSAGTLPLAERLSGTVRAENQVSVQAEIEAPIVEVLVRSGDVVERGQPLVRLESLAFDQRLRQAEANLRVAEATATEGEAREAELEARFVRMRALAEQALISEQELDSVEAQLLVARAAAEQAAANVDEALAAVEESRTTASKTVVRSPVSGRVGRRGLLASTLVTLVLIPVTYVTTSGALEAVRSREPKRAAVPAGSPASATFR